jgi:hypothetical protein
MRRFSFLLTVAAGLLASMAFSVSAQAGSLIVTDVFSVPGGTASDAVFQTLSPITAVTIDSYTNGLGNISVSALTGPSTSPGQLTMDFTPATSGTFVITLTTASTFLSSYTLDGLAGSPTSSNNNVTWKVGTVPEPASMALLGIGMAGIFACRRLFKRNAV